MGRTNLFELLGRPVGVAETADGTFVTASPDETYDDDSMLPWIEERGIAVMSAVESGGASRRPSAWDSGTLVTRSNLETYDDDSVLPLM